MLTIVKILDIIWVTIGLLGILYLLIREIPEQVQIINKQRNQILFLLNLSFLLFMISLAIKNTKPTVIEWIAAGLFATYVFFLSDFKRIPWIRICISTISYGLALVALVARFWPAIIISDPQTIIFAIVDFLWFFSAVVFTLYSLFENKLSVKSWILLTSVATGIITYVLTMVLIGLRFPQENVFAFIMWFVTLALVFVFCTWGLNLPNKNKKGKSIGWMTYVSLALPFVAFLSQIIARWFFHF